MRKLLLAAAVVAVLAVPVGMAAAAPPAKPTTTTGATTTTVAQPPAIRGYYVVERLDEIPADYTGEWFDTYVACTSGGKPLSGGISGITGWAIVKSFPAFPPPGGGANVWSFRLQRIPNATVGTGTVTMYATCAFVD